jgi:hypothetical protein
MEVKLIPAQPTVVVTFTSDEVVELLKTYTSNPATVYPASTTIQNLLTRLRYMFPNQ